MGSPSPKKPKASDSIKLTMLDLEIISDNNYDVWSPVHRIGGYPWRLRVNLNHLSLHVVCDKSTESELWYCKAKLKLVETPDPLHLGITRVTREFSNWEAEQSFHSRNQHQLGSKIREVEVTIEVDRDGEHFRARPTLGLLDVRDCALIVEGQKFYVNKQSLAGQSSYFKSLFFGIYKERNKTEIELKEVEPDVGNEFIFTIGPPKIIQSPWRHKDWKFSQKNSSIL